MLLLATHLQQHFGFFANKITPQSRIYQQIDCIIFPRSLLRSNILQKTTGCDENMAETLLEL
jgi:hypothetical protein